MGKFTANVHNNFHGNRQPQDVSAVNDQLQLHPNQLMNSIKIASKQILDLDNELLVYRAEGNANIVLSLPNSKNVLRLRKTFVDKINFEGKYLEKLWWLLVFFFFFF